MDKRPIFLLAGFLAVAVSATAGEAYRWVDSDGVVHYSDRPQEGAEVVELDENTTSVRSPQRRSNSSSNPTSSAADASTDSNAPVRYESIEIASPGAEETLWNIEGVLNVSLAVKPGLQPGHQVRVYFDGKPQIVQSTSFQIEEVFRGVHNLQAEIIDETGKMMIRSQPSRFYVQQNTVAF